MPAFWWRSLVSGRMSSLPLTMAVGWLTQSGVEMTDFDLCLSVSPFCYSPQWTSAYVDPHPPWKSRTKIHEMRCQMLLSLWHGLGGGVTEKGPKKKERKKRRSGAKLLAITTSVRVQLTADGLINLPSSQCGQAFTVGRRQMLLVAPKLHPRDTLPFGKWIWNCCNKYKK